MGCTSSAFEVAKRSPQFKQDMIQYQAMQMSESEIRKLYYAFRKVDVDGSGSIGLSEMLAHIDLPFTPFTEKVFSIFDDDKSGEIDFKEFVMSLWNYCTLTSVTLDMFAFDLYDNDGSGELSPSEVLLMLADIFGKNEMKTNVHAKAIAAELAAFETRTKEPFKIDNFHKFIKTHQAMLFPAFQMQLALQRKFLGTSYWETNANRRMELCDGKYISVGKFILEHAKAESVGQVQPLTFGKIGVSPKHAPVIKHITGTRAMRRKSVAVVDKHPAPTAGTSDGGKGSFSATLTESAKLRFAAASAGVQGFFASSGKHRKSPNKVYVSAKAPPVGFGNSSATTSNGSLLSLTSDASQPSPQKPSANGSHSHGTQLASPFVSPRVDGLPINPSLSAPNSHQNLNNLNGHSSSMGNVRAHRRGSREFKEPKEFEGLINATFANILDNANGAGAGTASHNASFSKGHGNKAGGNAFFEPMESEYDKKQLARRRSLGNVAQGVVNAQRLTHIAHNAISSTNNAGVAGAGAGLGAHDGHNNSHGKLPKPQRRRSFADAQ